MPGADDVHRRACCTRRPTATRRRIDGKRVLVVGSGSSGMEIAHDLATGGAAKMWLAVRTPPNIMLRSLPRGLPGDLVSLPLYHAPIRIADAMSDVSAARTSAISASSASRFRTKACSPG